MSDDVAFLLLILGLGLALYFMPFDDDDHWPDFSPA